jgi:hypothetical protein
LSDTGAGILAIVIALSHASLAWVGWAWATRRGHVGFLALLVPASVAWVLAGLPLIRALTYGTRPLGSPRTGLQTAGLIAILLASGGLLVGAAGSAIGLLRYRRKYQKADVESDRGVSGEERARWT